MVRDAGAGVRAFEVRNAKRTKEYSFERAQPAVFDRATESQLRANPAAAAFFDAQPPGYRKLATYWVMNAKQQDTRARRLAKLIVASADHRRL